MASVVQKYMKAFRLYGWKDTLAKMYSVRAAARLSCPRVCVYICTYVPDCRPRVASMAGGRVNRTFPGPWPPRRGGASPTETRQQIPPPTPSDHLHIYIHIHTLTSATATDGRGEVRGAQGRRSEREQVLREHGVPLRAAPLGRVQGPSLARVPPLLVCRFVGRQTEPH